MEHEFAISHLRDCLGVAYQHVANTDEPVIIRRYARTDVALERVMHFDEFWQ